MTGAPAKLPDNPLVVIFGLPALIFTILLMETLRVIKDNGPINTVISANKIFTGQHWVGIFDITTMQ